MKKRMWIILIAMVVIVAIVASYFSFFYYRNCKDSECFNSNLLKCKRAKFLDDKEDAVWKYNIEGKDNGKCKIRVSLLQLKEGDVGIGILQGKSMNCYLEIGQVTSPQANLENCHGLLKEDMQKLMIEKLFKYITENIGQIGEELESII